MDAPEDPLRPEEEDGIEDELPLEPDDDPLGIDEGDDGEGIDEEDC